MPAPPPPISSNLAPQILPSYFSPSSSNIAAPVEQLLVRTRSVGVNTCEVGVVTEPECLGPCEPGTSVNLEGIVWHETEEGVLVVNVTWRNKTYVGTLLDCTKHDWAPPRYTWDLSLPLLFPFPLSPSISSLQDCRERLIIHRSWLVIETSKEK